MFLALFWLQITLALLAAALLWLGVRGRAVDDHPHCRRCGYDLFGLAAGGAGGVCPECGANLRQRGAVRVGVRRRRRGLIALAIFCGVLSFSLGPARNLVWRELVGRPAAFAYAVRAGDAGAVEEHLTARPRLVKLRPAGQSLLDLAVSGSHGEEVVKRLLAAGADPNEVGSGNGFRPLHRAAWEDKPGVAHILLAGGADANVKDGNGERPLHFAARGPGPGTMPQILLAKGADPNARDAHDRSPLHSAASGRDVEVVQVLLDGKADVNAANDEGRTPLHLAAARRNWDVAVALLKAGASLSAQDRGGKVPVALAREGDVEAGVRFAAQLYERALQDRRAGDRLQEVRKALKADPSALREGGREGTLLHVAAALRQSDLVKVLLDAGADVTARDATGKTALHRACWGHDPPTVERLLAAGADANGRDDAGRAPLHVAADSPARAATAELLLKHGADAEARDKQGLTPLETAATSLQDSRAEFLEAVLSVGAKTDVYAAAALGREAALAKLLDGEPALGNGGPGAHRASPLHVAAMFGRVGTARVLLDHGADVNSGIDG